MFIRHYPSSVKCSFHMLYFGSRRHFLKWTFIFLEEASGSLVLRSPRRGSFTFQEGEINWWTLICISCLPQGGFLITLCLRNRPMMLIFREGSCFFSLNGLLLLVSRRIPGRPLSPYLILILERLSLEMYYLPWEARLLSNKVHGLSCEVSCLAHSSFLTFTSCLFEGVMPGALH